MTGDDWRTSSAGRVESFEFRLYDLDLRPIGTLDGVESCKLDGSPYADIRWGGQLVWSGSEQPDWSRILVHPWYIVDGVGEMPLAPPMLCKTPATAHSDPVPEQVTVSLYDVTLLVQRVRLTGPYAAPAGAVIVDLIEALLDDAGGRYAIEKSTKTLATPMNWDTGSTILSVVNGLLGALGYWALHASDDGVLLGVPWTAPATRAPSWDFATDNRGITAPDWSETVDDWSVPNRLTGVPSTAGTAAPAPVTVTLDDIAPGSPYTHANRGYWVDGEPLRNVAAADTAALTATLSAALLSAAAVASSASVVHAWIPEAELTAVVTYEGRRWVIQKASVTVELGLQMAGEWQEVL